MGLSEIKENRIKKDYGFIKSFIRIVKDETIARQFFFSYFTIRISTKLNNGYNAMKIGDKYLLSGISVIYRKFVRFV